LFCNKELIMIAPELLASGFQHNVNVIERLTDGLTHADSLLTPSFGGNCLNWTLGHLIVTRNRALALVGEAPIWAADTAARYQTGTDPITSAADPGIVPLAELLVALTESADRIAAALAGQTVENMAAEQNGQPVGPSLLGLYWHEAYHIGQLELLRRLAGKTEKVFG
jgi:hypothetical protein